MINARRIAIALSVFFALGAASLNAQLSGTWKGSGTGSCIPHPGIVIYPWQEWKGEIPDAEDVFSGEWRDSGGNHGTFKGTPLPSPIPEERRFSGEWTWLDPTVPSTQPVVGGKFSMTFYFLEGYCKGTWSSVWPSASARGTMKGERVD
ncbi:hypothetical protein GX441_08645 [bacterium]|nr:hypothetical protein [bacterium]